MSREERINQAIEFAFSTYDTDNSGTLDESELKEILKAVFAKMNIQREVNDADVKKMVKALDANSDGVISREEFRVLAEQCIK